VKRGFGYLKDGVFTMLSYLSPSNLKAKYQLLRSMTFKELILSFFRLNFTLAYTLLVFLFTISWYVIEVDAFSSNIA
jgi:hypothetical protein